MFFNIIKKEIILHFCKPFLILVASSFVLKFFIIVNTTMLMQCQIEKKFIEIRHSKVPEIACQQFFTLRISHKESCLI